MIITCSNCNARYNIKEKKISPGKQVRCLKCKTPINIKTGHKNVDSRSQPKGDSDSKFTEEPDQVFNYKPPNKKAPKGAPAWIVTFADLATLMLTFFVLLLFFANMDIVKFKDMLGSVQSAFGVTKKEKGEYQAVLTGDNLDSDKPTPSSSDSDASNERKIMANAIKKTVANMKDSDNISVSVSSEGVRVRIKGTYLFDIGRASLKNESFPFLNSISLLMNKFPFKMKVEGHTDNIPISTPQFPSNWELSAIRATTVLRYFSETNKVDKTRLTAIGYADNKPIGPNEEPWGRAKNRRVEFIFYK